MSKGESMESRYKIYGVVIVALILLYGVNFSQFDKVVIPTPGRIRAKETQIKQLDAQLSNLNKEQEKRLEQRARIRQLVADFYAAKGKVLTTEIQLEIERLGKRSNVILSQVGAPKPTDISDNIQAIDVTVSSTASIKNISSFLKEIDQHKPILVWHNCQIRPNKDKDPTAVAITGIIRAYVIKDEITDYIEGAAL